MAPPLLDFARGKAFQLGMRQKFGHPVVFSPGFRQREFKLVVSFGRACFRLDCHTVSIVLQSCFGGYPQGFRVKFLRDRSFQFSVASKSVGFELYNSGRISERDFELVFSLWGEGGPNWRREDRLFYQEEQNSWSLVTRGPSRSSSQSGSGNRRRELPRHISVFQRLALLPDSS